jgi:hypothetical protein
MLKNMNIDDDQVEDERVDRLKKNSKGRASVHFPLPKLRWKKETADEEAPVL